MTAEARADLLIAGAAFSATVARLAGGGGSVPKGVYRFKTHENANRCDEAWLAAAMARRTSDRERG